MRVGLPGQLTARTSVAHTRKQTRQNHGADSVNASSRRFTSTSALFLARGLVLMHVWAANTAIQLPEVKLFLC